MLVLGSVAPENEWLEDDPFLLGWLPGCKSEVPKVSKVVAPQGEGHFLKDPSFFIYGYFWWFLEP